MQELTKIYRQRGNDFINDLFNNYLLVSEKLSGSSFSFKRTDDNLSFYKGNSQRPINLVDRTLMIYYEKPISYITKSVTPIITSIPNGWEFCFQYFAHNEPGIIKYDHLPKNNLVLTHIIIKSETGKVAKIIDDPRVIGDWSKILNVTPLKPIFKGYLTQEQKSKIKEFISLSIEDQEELFGTNSFASYLIHLLNPSIQSTTLNNSLNTPIDSIIFKFFKPGTKQTFSSKLIDPYTKSLTKKKNIVDVRRSPADINEIILLDILAFLEERGLKKHEVLSSTPEERYIELISAIFNDYVRQRGSDIKNLNFEKADFAKAKEFDLNVNIINNQKTKELINSSESLKDLFKVILGSLRKTKNPKKAGQVLTKTVLNDFNAMIQKIEKIINETNDGQFKTFNDYINLKNTNENVFNQNDIEDNGIDVDKFISLDKVSIKKT